MSEDIYKQFGLDQIGGFVQVTSPPLLRLTDPYYEPWERIADDIPLLTSIGRLRTMISQLEVLQVDSILENKKECERAMLVLTFISHCYIRGSLCDPNKERLPVQLAQPWIRVASRLGLPPVSTFAAAILYNWKFVDPAGSFCLSNVICLLLCSGTTDEAWFFQVQLMIEAVSGKIIPLVFQADKGVREQDSDSVADALQKISGAIEEIIGLLKRMYEECTPWVFYHRVRKYLSGWDTEGLYYGNESTPRFYSGSSAAQSALIQLLDIVLGIVHPPRPSSEFLIEMRNNYMPHQHRNFLEYIQQRISIKEYATKCGGLLLQRLEECVNKMKTFRDKHLQMVALYIIQQASKDGQSMVTGTGGSNPIPFLRQIRADLDQN